MYLQQRVKQTCLIWVFVDVFSLKIATFFFVISCKEKYYIFLTTGQVCVVCASDQSHLSIDLDQL